MPQQRLPLLLLAWLLATAALPSTAADGTAMPAGPEAATAAPGREAPASPPTDARTEIRKQALAAQLTTLMQARRIATDFLEQCSKLEGSQVDPRRTFTSNRDAFGGITPWSLYWDEIVALYAKYQARTCASVSAERYAAYVTDQYASKLSLKDLQAAVKFYSSPAGRRFNEAAVDTSASFQAFLFVQTNAAIPDAARDLRREVQAVVERYRQDPR